MASFKQLTNTEIAAVIAYTRTAWGNKVDQFVQPSEVKVARK
jgi:cytochrome c oxidase subunit II